jgi:hypothetical protein
VLVKRKEETLFDLRECCGGKEKIAVTVAAVYLKVCGKCVFLSVENFLDIVIF